MSLADLDPEVAAEWHPTLNAALTAADVNPGSKTPRWWICSVCGHAWVTTPDKRTRRGDGCRECSPIGTSARQVRLEHELKAAGLPVVYQYPPIAVPGRRPVRADIVIPDQRLVVEYDGVRFHADLDKRDRAQTAALTSAGWTVLRVREHPLHGLGGHEVFVSPTEPIKSVTLKVLGALDRMGYAAARLDEYRSDPHVWAEPEAEKAIHKYRKVSLSSEHPALAIEFDPDKNNGVRADQVHPRSHTKFVWTCSACANKWSSTVALRAAGHGCPRCGYQRVADKLSRPKPGESFADRFPERAIQWHPTQNGTLTPDQVRPASNKMAWWLCEQGHEWQARVATRRRSGCPDCYKADRIRNV
jgi:hypothetical protein